MKSSRTLQGLFFRTRSSTNFSKTDQELWAWIDHTLVARTLKCPKHWSHKANRLLSKEAALFISKAPWHVYGAHSQLEAPRLYKDSLSNCTNLCKLSLELHRMRPKKSVLILLRKIKCFFEKKRCRFWPFFISQWKAPQKITSSSQKCRVLLRFSFVHLEALGKNITLRMKLQ